MLKGLHLSMRKKISKDGSMVKALTVSTNLRCGGQNRVLRPQTQTLLAIVNLVRRAECVKNITCVIMHNRLKRTRILFYFYKRLRGHVVKCVFQRSLTLCVLCHCYREMLVTWSADCPMRNLLTLGQ